VIVARSLEDASAAIVAAGVQANEGLRAGDDTLSRDYGQAHSVACAEAFGLSWDEVDELAAKYIDETNEMILDMVAGGTPTKMAIDSSIYAAVVAAVLSTGCVISGVDPPDGVYPFSEHPEIAAGGWMCAHGEMVTVLGVDASGNVAMQVKGKLVPNHRRPSPEAFLGHYTRIDDVPVLGGGAT
jgi:hypothetical protein